MAVLHGAVHVVLLAKMLKSMTLLPATLPKMASKNLTVTRYALSTYFLVKCGKQYVGSKNLQKTSRKMKKSYSKIFSWLFLK